MECDRSCWRPKVQSNGPDSADLPVWLYITQRGSRAGPCSAGGGELLSRQVDEDTGRCACTLLDERRQLTHDASKHRGSIDACV